MLRSIYSLLYYLLLPFALFRLGHRAERLALYRAREGAGHKRPEAGTLIFHTASLGELHAALPLIRACRQAWPDQAILLTTSSETGAARARELLPELPHCYLPFDTPGAVRRFLSYFRPAAILIMETELWPNLLHQAAATDCRLLLINGRMSEKSCRRYRRFAGFSRELLACFDLLAVQYEQDAERFRMLGASADRLLVTGSMKFDMTLDEERIREARLFKAGWQRQVVIAGSTRKGEEDKVLMAFRKVLQERPDCLLVLVPRHPERFDEVAELLKAQALSFVRRSDGVSPDAETRVLLGDSLGEMQFYYALGDIAFVGGSLVDTGCQNIIEPAALGLPVITGPSLYNFPEVSALLNEAGALQVVEDAGQLAAALVRLLRDDATRTRMGMAARQLVASRQGSTGKLLALLTGIIAPARRSDQ